ncbi:dihydrolipoyl dehydrogenase [Pelomicrobium sp. G1]|uniref:dihydrolipoyl dehydrogenase n=1 Tax=unclassified Pelomicrobium TaxID=2815318 RepID=UPI003F76A9BD
MAKNFDVLVIGAGPGGYIAAIRAAQLGFSVGCIERWRTPRGEPALGGTCLNVGCIPSKALLESSENYERVLHKFAEHGITAERVTVDLAKMLARKDRIVGKMTGGIATLFKKNKIEWLQGHGRFVSGGNPIRVEVTGEDGVQTVEARHVIVATGSKARHLPGVEVDQEVIADNEGALSFDSVPKRLGVIGAGVIGLELGSVWRRLGAQVTLLEALPEFLPAADEAVSKEAWKLFTREQGLDIRLGVKILEVQRNGRTVVVEYEDDKGRQSLGVDRLIVSVGRVPNTDGLGLEAIGLSTDARGFIEVDEHCRTRVPNVYAIGDVVRGPMLAHKAEDEGVMVAERIAGQAGHVNYDAIPWVIYTAPEIAWVGKTEQQLKQEGVKYRSGRFPFSINGRALGQGEPAGFVKILAHGQTDRVLGVHIVGTHASELISEAVMALEFSASAEDIARICHPHPSLSEVVREAALAVDKRALNM